LASAIKVPIDVAAFLAAVEQASIVTSDESRGVRFAWDAGKLTLTSQAADVGSSEVEMSADYDGPEVFAVFDPRYLTDCLKTIPDELEFSVSILDHKNAALFRTADGLDYIVMPLSVER
jgi:DNA polymerase-3 subunit beta